MSYPQNGVTPPKQGFFHQMKKHFKIKNKKIEDPAFDLALSQFNQMQELVRRLKTNSQIYVDSIQKLFISSNAVSVDIGTMLQQEDNAERRLQSRVNYSPFIASMTEQHHFLAGDASQRLCTRAATEILEKLDHEMLVYQGIRSRLLIRKKLRDEMFYYKVKLGELESQKDLRGREDTLKESDKLQRNSKKHQDSTALFEPFNHELVSDMEAIWKARQSLLGPVLYKFYQLESQLSSTYIDSTRSIIPLRQEEVDMDISCHNQQLQSASNKASSTGTPPVSQPPLEFREPQEQKKPVGLEFGKIETQEEEKQQQQPGVKYEYPTGFNKGPVLSSVPFAVSSTKEDYETSAYPEKAEQSFAQPSSGDFSQQKSFSVIIDPPKEDNYFSSKPVTYFEEHPPETTLPPNVETI